MASRLSFLRNPMVVKYLAGAGATYIFVNNTEAHDNRLWKNTVTSGRPIYNPIASYCLTKFTIRKFNPIAYTILWPITIGSVVLFPVGAGLMCGVTKIALFIINLFKP